MNLLLATLIIVTALAAIALLALRARQHRVAILAVFFLSLHALFIVTFGMGGIRAHVEQARSKGASDDFVEGLIERNWFYLAPRVATGVVVLGLFTVATAALRQQRKQQSDVPRDITEHSG